MATTTDPSILDAARMTRAQRATLPLSADVAQALAEQHGVCIRPLAMRRIDTTTGRVDIVPVPCGSTREDQCPPCSEKARRLRMVQCRQGWHLDAEPVTDRTTPSEEHKELMATRADLLAVYTECRAVGDEVTCEQIAESVAELDVELRAAGVRGRLAPLDPPPKPVKRSTRRRQDAPDLPRRPVDKRTVGRVFAGRYRPSTFLTLTLDSYGRVDSHGAAVDPERYDYRRAARDAIHFPALVDRFWQNTRRCVGWDVQYFGTCTQMVGQYLAELGRKKYQDIARALKVPLERVQAAAQFIATLQPRPGSSFQLRRQAEHRAGGVARAEERRRLGRGDERRSRAAPAHQRHLQGSAGQQRPRRRTCANT